MQEIEQLEKSLYFLVINTVGLLKSLKKLNIENQSTVNLAKFARLSYDVINKILDNEKTNDNQKIIKIKEFIPTLIVKIQDILIEEFNNVSKEITHEKSDVYTTAIKINEMINNLKIYQQ